MFFFASKEGEEHWQGDRERESQRERERETPSVLAAACAESITTAAVAAADAAAATRVDFLSIRIYFHLVPAGRAYYHIMRSTPELRTWPYKCIVREHRRIGASPIHDRRSCCSHNRPARSRVLTL